MAYQDVYLQIFDVTINSVVSIEGNLRSPATLTTDYINIEVVQDDVDNTYYNLDFLGETIIIKSTSPFQYVSRILSYTDQITILGGSPELEKEFRWSLDGETFSDWLLLTNENLSGFIPFNKINEFWLEYRYTLLNEASCSLTSLRISAEFAPPNPYTNWVPERIFFLVEKNTRYSPTAFYNGTYQPYQQKLAVELLQKLSLFVNNLYGHEVTYVRANPSNRSRDVVLGEYTIYKRDLPKCVKILVPENTFPDNKINYGALGMDFELPFEVHVDKKYFEQIFGRGILPQKRDAIYFPLLDRLYEVSSSQLVRDFMQTGIYYKLSLVKWSPKSNIIENEITEKEFSDLTESLEKTFDFERNIEETNIVNPQQTQLKRLHSDIVRKFLDVQLACVDYKLMNHGTMISNFYYDLNTPFAKELEHRKVVEYHSIMTLPKNKDLTITAWFSVKNFRTYNKKVERIEHLEKLGNQYQIYYGNDTPNFQVGDWLKITHANLTSLVVYGKIMNVDLDPARRCVLIELPTAIQTGISSVHPDWWKKSALTSKMIPRRVILDALDVDKKRGVKIEILDDTVLLTLNNKTFYYKPGLSEDRWYSFVLGVSNRFNQISFRVYQITSQAGPSTKLEKVFQDLQVGLDNIDYSSKKPYEIETGAVWLTNLRVLTDVLEEEKQSTFLNLYMISDSYLASVVDNALPRLDLPYVGDPK